MSKKNGFRVLAGEGVGGDRSRKGRYGRGPKEDLSQDVSSDSLALGTVSLWSGVCSGQKAFFLLFSPKV